MALYEAVPRVMYHVASLPPLFLGTCHTKLLGSRVTAEVPSWYGNLGLIVLDARSV
jgi:hypothetical protein